MKRRTPPTKNTSPTKKPRPEVPAYHLTPQIKDEDGNIQWPAPRAQIQRAREIIQQCAAAQKTTVIVPDKDADGLTAGAILRHTLLLLGLPQNQIHVHLLSKGNTVHSEEECLAISSHGPSYVFILDHGSRAGPPIVQNAEATHTLIIDHHYATETDFPQASEHVTACHSPPVATTSLLTYEICLPLHPDVGQRCDWLCIVGTHGDLGNTLKWEPPFPDMRETLKKHTKKSFNDVVSLINAPRRTATYDVRSAWDAVADTDSPASILQNRRLLGARAEINAEVERCTHTAPKFSPDGKIAVFRIASPCQIHPVIATRWAGHLNSKALEVVMVANEGYLPGRVNFSCRIPRCARNRETEVSIIERLRYYASLPDPGPLPKDGDGEGEAGGGEQGKRPLLERLGDDFARGHVQASGGIVGVDEFEELMRIMRIGEKVAKKEGTVGPSPTKSKKRAGIDPGQTNTLMGYFKKPAAATVDAQQDQLG